MRVVARKVQVGGVGAVPIERMVEMSYDSVSDAMDGLKRARFSAQNMYLLNQTMSPYGSDHWLGAGVRDPSHFYELVQNGAPQLRDRMLSMMDQIELPEAMTRPELSNRRRRVRADFGNSVDIHRVYQGRCDVAWDRMIMEKQETHGNKLVHMVIDNCAPGIVHADNSLWMGAAIMRIYEALTRMRRSVAISVYDAAAGLYYGDPKHGMVSVLVKDYGQPLREEQLAVVCSQAFSRAVLMPLQSVDSHKYGGHVDHMGYATSDYELLVKSAEDDVARGGSVIVIGKAFNKEQAERTVYDFVAKHVYDETTEGKNTRQLYGFEDTESLDNEEAGDGDDEAAERGD